jgi:gamma-glutamyltranspeptidase/glutathione hydrolase
MKKRKEPVYGESAQGMVSTASRVATEAGSIMLEKGGNAVDAAVASAFCLGVTEPQASGLGGQTMALIYLKEKQRVFVLDGSSRAPYRIQPHKTPEKPLKLGLQASTIPSTPATLGYMQEQYGKLSLSEVLEPAIEAAEKGFRVSSLQHRLIHKEADWMRKDDSIFEHYFQEGKPAAAGSLIKQPELATTLSRMAKVGWEDFYLGEIGKKIVEDMVQRNGLISQTDLSQIPLPVEREVLTSSYREYTLHTFPPPGAGRVLVQLMNILENFPSEQLNPETPEGAVLFALAFRMTLSDRQKMPIHPDYFSQITNRVMSDKSYAKEVAEKIHYLMHQNPRINYAPPPTSGETTHLSVADQEGNAVGITQSIELVFGSKTMAKGLGFFYNNYMSAFEYKDVTHPYYLLPGGRPWSSVAPTLMMKENTPHYILGSPGSERISTSLAQVITRLVDEKKHLSEAIAAPRLHVSHTGRLQIELERFDEEVIHALKELRFSITKRGPYSFYLGCVQGVAMPQKSETLFCGVADPRRDGSAKGPERKGD